MARSVMAAGWFRRSEVRATERGSGEGEHPPRRDPRTTNVEGAQRAGLSGAVRARDLRTKPPLLKPPL